MRKLSDRIYCPKCGEVSEMVLEPYTQFVSIVPFAINVNIFTIYACKSCKSQVRTWDGLSFEFFDFKTTSWTKI